jgi:apolipoprotein N-acyltransferase
MFQISSGIRANLVAIFAGILLCFSFSPFNFSLLAFIAVAIFKGILEGIPVKTAALRGFFFGLGLFVIGVSWVYVSMTLNTQGLSVLAILMTLLFCSFWATFFALFAYLYVKFCQNKLFDIFLFTSFWILSEYIRGTWVLNGFPWLQVAYSQLDSPLSAYIPIFGAYGTGGIIVICACLLADYVARRRISYLMSIATIFSIALMLDRVNWVQPAEKSFKATLIQGNIAQKDKWHADNKQATLQQYYDDTVKNWNSELIVWPETAIPAYYNAVLDNYLLPLQKEAVENNTDILTSLPYRNKQGQLYNTAVVLGKNHALYKKIHLLPFGEYLPWQPISGYLLNFLDIRLGEFTAGDLQQPLLKVAGHSIITSICYEDAFGAQSIHHVEQARFLVNLTNDGWFDGSIEPYQHLQIARMRALEAGRYLLRVTNTGVTAVITEKGHILKQAPVAERVSISAMVTPMQGLTPYVQMGDKVALYLALLLLLIVLGIERGKLFYKAIVRWL